jgi:methyl coenzyme M reductase subunit C
MIHGACGNRQRAEIVQAAFHQLKVIRMSPGQRARHDPYCRLCVVQVPWKSAGLELILQLRARDGSNGPAALNSGGAT